MPEYRVIWQIDLDAESPRAAAERAAATVRKLDVDDECSATVFDVYERHASVVQRTGMRIDLSNESENRSIRLTSTRCCSG
ncbi:MAG: hypothetical protein ACREKH_00070 [Candidatus Rokuibacteriota bacterium]